MDRVVFYKSREIEGTLKNITVSRRAGQWFASLQVEQDVQIATHPYPWEVGIDSGINSFAAFSDGHMTEGAASFRRHEEALAKEQRKLARKQKGSQNWRKQKEKISKLHHTIANVRIDFLHKLSTRESKNQARVYVERLNIRGMSASAKGEYGRTWPQCQGKGGSEQSDPGPGMVCGSNRNSGRKQESVKNREEVLPLLV